MITLRAAVARVLLVAGTLSLSLFPSPALASSAAVVGEELLIGAGTGETNRMTVRVVDSRISISDRAGIEAGAGCRDEGRLVTCRARNVQLVVIHTEDGDDVVRLGDVAAFVDAGPGNDVIKDLDGKGDTLMGGEGDDYIDSQDGARDRLDGGPGEDEYGTNCGDRAKNFESGVVGCA